MTFIERDGKSIPDPIKLLRRISALEITIKQLTKDCESMSKRKNKILPRIMNEQIQNISLITEVRIKFQFLLIATMHAYYYLLSLIYA